jgi:hypothetical protein
MSDDWGLLDKDGDAEPTCPKCENILEWVECDRCGGEGLDGHDCGEDTCACLDPEPNEQCEQCSGEGGWYRCWRCEKRR